VGAILYALPIGLHSAARLALLCARSEDPVSLLKLRNQSNRAGVGRAGWKQEEHVGHKDL